MKKNRSKFDIVIIGGGASGLFAAIAAKQEGGSASVLLLERRERVGKKLMATGNGRCNFTNIHTAKENYHGKNRDFVVPALEQLTPQDTIAFFRNIGIVSVTEEGGKVYPMSLQASSVLDMLRFYADALGVETHTEAEVTAINKKDKGFSVITAEEELEAAAVILAAGGQASPQLGGTDLGYSLAKSLGHTLVATAPSLVQIKTDHTFTKALKGIKIQGTAVLKGKGQVLGAESGEILFTEYGLSGPPILQLSRKLVGENMGDLTIALDFVPHLSQKEVHGVLLERQQQLGYLTLENYLTGFLHKKTGQLLMKSLLKTQLSRSVDDLFAEELLTLAKGLKAYEISVEGVTGWKNAQVTAGGIDTLEVDKTTMESRKVPHFYLCGEVLDIDGDCGGFNLQWAWSSGRLAGKTAGRSQYHA